MHHNTTTNQLAVETYQGRESSGFFACGGLVLSRSHSLILIEVYGDL